MVFGYKKPIYWLIRTTHQNRTPAEECVKRDNFSNIMHIY